MKLIGVAIVSLVTLGCETKQIKFLEIDKRPWPYTLDQFAASGFTVSLASADDEDGDIYRIEGNNVICSFESYTFRATFESSLQGGRISKVFYLSNFNPPSARQKFLSVEGHCVQQFLLSNSSGHIRIDAKRGLIVVDREATDEITFIAFE